MENGNDGGAGRQIVKVQLPLASNHEEGLGVALVYAKGHVNLQHMQITQELLDKMGDHPKRFFYATWAEPAGWTIGNGASWQNW